VSVSVSVCPSVCVEVSLFPSLPLSLHLSLPLCPSVSPPLPRTVGGDTDSDHAHASESRPEQSRELVPRDPDAVQGPLGFGRLVVGGGWVLVGGRCDSVMW
jgi:hypothetical protein